jgi:hypothetical protein
MQAHRLGASVSVALSKTWSRAGPSPPGSSERRTPERPDGGNPGELPHTLCHRAAAENRAGCPPASDRLGKRGGARPGGPRGVGYQPGWIDKRGPAFYSAANACYSAAIARRTCGFLAL